MQLKPSHNINRGFYLVFSFMHFAQFLLLSFQLLSAGMDRTALSRSTSCRDKTNGT